MSPREPSGASKSLFKNLEKPDVFTRFWVQRPPKRPSRNPRAAQEAPKDLQRTKKIHQKNQDKCLRGKKCLRLAITFLTISRTNFRAQNCTVFNMFYKICFYHFFEKCWNSFWNPFWDQSGPRGPRWAQKSHQELQRTKNLHFQKPLKTHWFFKGFWLQRLLKKASRGPRWLPKDTQKIQDPKK